MKATYKRYILEFKTPSGTSRGILHTKETYFITITDENKSGIGECGLLKGLSLDDTPAYEEKLKWVCENINQGLFALLEETVQFPSIQFGLEQAFLTLHSPDGLLFPSDFTKGLAGIPINGLIWMGTKSDMEKQLRAKIERGYNCVKLKIGAIAFDTEYEILKTLRKEYPLLEIRVDANGAFSPETAMKKLTLLAKLKLHSIEQPIQAGQIEQMAMLCEKTPLSIALDEELIGVLGMERERLLETIKPQYIILKPSLVGGFIGSTAWIDLARKQEIGWWITSALESNIGLNAIAQWTYTLHNKMPQGLGTGGLYTNNIASPLEIRGEKLWYNP